jgi:hypothetical protein
MARAGQHEQAVAIAGSISSPVWRGSALAHVAEALAQAGDAGPAARAAAVVCAVGRWTSAVGPVLLLAPSAYPSLARTLEEQ